ncbi:MAG: hypothetical protein J6B73_08415 [Methanobrevibacter sp.]|uniref:hypothetical protein n=1 Tax=Methanobrevibacter sp. TaxID=66852 RepID=UPI001B1A1230|nr:hypothetical protein [Methanobrevibacter sp.]MBO5152163.1 hypothetical protein [Methanobrevibacter sp.]MBO6111366.1 hypothetical protein [Methanobrevibacter sp.]
MIASIYFSKYFLKILTIGPMIMADMTVPSRTPAKYPKNIMDNAAAVIIVYFLKFLPFAYYFSFALFGFI